jgi:hypothetical protein
MAFLAIPWLRNLFFATAAGILVFSYGWIEGGRSARAKCQTDALQAQVATLTARAAAAEKLANDYADRLRIDADLDRLNEERANATPPDDSPCLPAGAVERLRSIR